jgi:hypothetical protein
VLLTDTFVYFKCDLTLRDGKYQTLIFSATQLCVLYQEQLQAAVLTDRPQALSTVNNNNQQMHIKQLQIIHDTNNSWMFQHRGSIFRESKCTGVYVPTECSWYCNNIMLKV